MAEAIQVCHGHIRELCDLQNELIAKVGVKKNEFVSPPDDCLLARLRAQYFAPLRSSKQTVGKQARNEACNNLRKEALAAYIPDPAAPGALHPDRFNTV